MRLKLADLLVKPMQRVTKYGLLLKNALSKTVSEEDRSALENMVYIYIYIYILSCYCIDSYFVASAVILENKVKFFSFWQLSKVAVDQFRIKLYH